MCCLTSRLLTHIFLLSAFSPSSLIPVIIICYILLFWIVWVFWSHNVVVLQLTGSQTQWLKVWKFYQSLDICKPGFKCALWLYPNLISASEDKLSNKKCGFTQTFLLWRVKICKSMCRKHITALNQEPDGQLETWKLQEAGGIIGQQWKMNSAVGALGAINGLIILVN